MVTHALQEKVISRCPQTIRKLTHQSARVSIEYHLRRGDESQALPSLWLFFFPFWGTWGESNPGKSDPTVTKLPSGTWPSKICKKNTLITSLRLFFWPPRQAPPPTPPILTSFAKTTLPSLPAGFRNKYPTLTWEKSSIDWSEMHMSWQQTTQWPSKSYPKIRLGLFRLTQKSTHQV